MGELLKEGGAYQQFVDCKTGSSNTALVIVLKEKLNKFLGLEREEKTENVYLCMEQVLVLECTLEEFLKNHSRIQYGKWETRRLLTAVKELPLVLRTDIMDWKEKITAFQDRERAFFEETGLNDIPGKLKKYGVEEQDINNIYGKIRNMEGNVNEAEESIIKNYLSERKCFNEEEIRYYIRYMVRKKEIENKLGQ